MLLKKLISHAPTGLLYLCIINLIVIGVAIGGRFLFPWQPITVFRVYYYGAQLGLVLAAIALVCLVVSLFVSVPSRQPLFIALLLALLPLLAALPVVGPGGFTAPMIHDISTDTDIPPEFNAVHSLRLPGENTLEYGGSDIAEKQRQAFPDIQPLNVSEVPLKTLATAASTVAALDWTMVELDEDALTIEAYDTSTLFGFIDDVIIRVTPMDGGSRIDVRSVSRVGLGDLGANADRIRRFMKQFNDLRKQ